ncbi:MAG: radical SAM protein [Deltaproteobacteria bacterium]|nr:radical SAM protein [Deltaproteobacteria bacterium]
MDLAAFFKKGYPSLDWIQVEISSYCNANCIYCPQSIYKRNWQARFLPLKIFRLLVPAFEKTGLVYLQGWGEPLMHPEFFEMLKIAKDSGCITGTTTNGTLLDQDSIEKLVDGGLDIIGFSLAGVDENNDSIRKGTRIKEVLDSMERLNKVKDRSGTETPRIHIAYMLLRSRLGDLEKLPAFLAGTGATQTVISSLSLVTTPEMVQESILACGEQEYEELEARLTAVKEESQKMGMDVHFHLVSPLEEGGGCSENILRALVVGANGDVSPCVMTQVPVSGENFYYFQGQVVSLQRLIFGNIAKDSLNTIWSRKEYRNFRDSFRKGRVPGICQRCYKRFIDSFAA